MSTSQQMPAPTKQLSSVELGDHPNSWEEDPRNPYNYSTVKKWTITLTVTFFSLVSNISSAISTPAVPNLQSYFGVNAEIATMTVSLFVLGWALGALLWGGMSDVYGRNIVYYPSWFIFVVFSIPCALAKNVETHLVCRFISALGSSASVSITGGSLHDVWPGSEIGLAMAIYMLIIFLGPVLSPVIGGYIVEFAPGGIEQSWRWTMWVVLLMTGTMALTFIWFPETHHKVIQAEISLQKEIVRRNALETWFLARRKQAVDQRASFGRIILAPLKLLMIDPSVLLMSTYVALLYGILFLYFGAYPYVFGGIYHWDQGSSGLAFLGLAIGVLVTFPTSIYGSILHTKLKGKNASEGIFPEGRLPLAMVASILAPIGVFWFAWTSFATIHWLAPIASGAVFCWTVVTILICLISYLTDVYRHIGSCLISAVTFERCMFAFAFPLFLPRLYENLGPHWGTSVLGFCLVLFMPVPYLFYIYGKRIRESSTYKDHL